MGEDEGAIWGMFEECGGLDVGCFEFTDGRYERLCCHFCLLEGKVEVSRGVSDVVVTHVGQRKGIWGLDEDGCSPPGVLCLVSSIV